ncbi:DEK domain-containing chromatin associated protein [Zea mays]|uniref:DEK domain-containing chromatin associated protein n=1 Tax=Zea mays TaxID=4577 RepID=A0A1D6KWP0_MAIZE|nr:DEK domain-containing chromatin associated protein [Zea mays]ONM06886.1 DEK domain-containing chromatin associated protein [Zea mays]ONM06888.1 DEK domain-containing chromatin associated protein [Zea mays]
MEEKAMANGAATADVAAPDNKDNTKEEASESKEPAANQDADDQNKGLENGAEGQSGGDVNMADAEVTEEGDGDPGVAKQVDSEDIKTDADTKEDGNAKAEEVEDVKMTEADTGSTEVKDKEEKGDEVVDTTVDKQDESKEQEEGVSAEQDEKQGEEAEEKGKEMDADEKQEEEAEEKGSADEKDEDEGDQKMEENKEETPKNKKARSARDRSQGNDNKHDGSKSREAKSLLNTPSPYGTDRPQRERKIVERLVEVIEKEPNRNFVVEKGRGTPLKDIPSVAHRISRKKPSDLKFLHSILFGRKGKAVDFKGHILQFSGFVWHESKKVTKGKGESVEAVLPSKDDLRKTITEILKKVDFNTATFSDILKKLGKIFRHVSTDFLWLMRDALTDFYLVDNHYKMDLAPKKEAIKVMIQDELTKLSEEDEGEGAGDTEKKQQQPQAKEIEA